MTVATLAELLQPALRDRYAVAGLVCLGWEDARAYVEAAEAENAAAILMVGPGARGHMPLAIWGPMLRHLAEEATVPICIHLDHGRDISECRAAIDVGFSSLMYDGSRLPLEENIARTREVADLAHGARLSCEGEIGFVGYDGGEQSAGTDPAEAARFARETEIDAMAISVGNVHLQQSASSGLDEGRIAGIEALTEVPLVIHGGSGVPVEQRRLLARTTSICKFNIGTELRMTFGHALRSALAADPDQFDRLALLKHTHEPMVNAARAAIRSVR